MQPQDYHIFTLPNGLRCVHWRTEGYVTYFGVAVNAGSSDDGDATPGLAHFVEHTLFKGTLHRRSWHISNRMEVVGGELNAYTTKEETIVYTNAPVGYLDRAMDLIADLIGYCSFPAGEVEREKEVVLEEINSYLDSPCDSVYDQFEDLMFAGSGLGHNILGTPESVRNLSPTETRGFIDRFYTPGNMVLYCADPHPHSVIEKLASRHFSFLHFPDNDSQRQVPPENSLFDIKRDNDGHQSHTIYGARAFKRTDPRRHALLMLNNYLGGPCMNSRLNQELREKRGLVYTVDSTVAMLSETGLMQIYFGCERGQTEKCLKLIRRELERLAESPVSPRIFELIKQQYRGQLLLSSDNKESRAMALAKSIMYYGEIHDIAYTQECLESVTAEDMRAACEQLLQNGFSRLTLQ